MKRAVAPVTTTSKQRRRRARASAVGFTLVELMVTLAGGLFLSIGVFMISRDTSALYQRETRVANASLASVIGFERLRADISRAAFMTSPHVRRDPFVCGSPATDGAWPARLARMSSIEIANPMAASPLSDNGLSPQSILIAGNFSSAEAFPIRAVFADSGDFKVPLQVQTGAMSRIGYNDVGADKAAVLGQVFPIGRAVRIVDKSGRHHYGTLEAIDVDPEPVLTIAGGAPDLIFRDGSALGCGLKGEETGAMINTVNFVRYQLRSLATDSRYKPIYDVAGPDYDDSRVELVRDELDPTGAPIDGSAELVAEYAVDLRFGLTVARNQREELRYVDEPDEMAPYVGDTTQMDPSRGPQMVRALHARLSVRSREADRSSNISVEQGPIYRIGLGAGGGAPFARVRTVQARIALHNQMGVTWQ